MEKHETCRHAIKSGELVVYVTPGCSRADMIHGTLVSSKIRCRDCKSWERKETQDGEDNDD